MADRKRRLDPYTLRRVVAGQRRRMRGNQRYWAHDDWVHMWAFLERLLSTADRLDSASKKRKAAR